MGHGRRASGLNFTTSRPRFNPIGKCTVAGKHLWNLIGLQTEKYDIVTVNVSESQTQLSETNKYLNLRQSYQIGLVNDF